MSSWELRHPSLPDVAVADRVHLAGRLDVVAGAVELEPALVGHVGAGLDAQQQFLRLGVFLPRVVAVVGDDRRDVQLLRDVEQAVADPRLDLEAVVHQLEEVVLRAEDVAPLGGGLERLFFLAEPEPGLHLARRAAGGRHQAPGVLADELLVRAGPLGEPAFGERPRRDLEEVEQALLVLGPDRLVHVGAGRGDVVLLLVRLAPQDLAGIVAAFRCDVGLDADDRGDAGVHGLPVELGGAEQVAVVGHRHVRHAQGLDLFEQVLEPRRAVQHRVLGVHVQVSVRKVPLGRGRRGCRHEPTAS